jgi:hypothetical protein
VGSSDAISRPHGFAAERAEVEADAPHGVRFLDLLLDFFRWWRPLPLAYASRTPAVLCALALEGEWDVNSRA